MVTDAMTKMQTGGLAELRTSIGSLAQGLKNAGMDIDQSTIDKIANGDLAASQTLESQIKSWAIRQLKEDATGTGRVMRTEVDTYMNMLSSEKDPRAILNILNQARQTMQQEYDKAMAHGEFERGVNSGDPAYKGYKLHNFESWYAAQLNQKKMAEQNKAGGLALGPIDESKIKGLPQPKAVGRWDPEQGKIVPIKE